MKFQDIKRKQKIDAHVCIKITKKNYKREIPFEIDSNPIILRFKLSFYKIVPI
jgi:hypothetical protein